MSALTDQVWTEHDMPADKNGFRYVVRTRHTETWTDFEAFGPTYADDRSFERKGSGNGLDRVESLDDAEPQVTGYVKWDGCTEFSCNPHFCGRGSVAAFAELLTQIHDLAGKLMGRDPESMS